MSCVVSKMVFFYVQVQLKIECEFVRDVLRGDDVYEIRMRLKEIMQDNYQADDE